MTPGATGWIFALASLGWAAVLHQGLGPTPKPPTLQWYEPTGFLLRSDSLAAVFTSPTLAFTAFGGPAALLAAVVLATARSSIARAVTLTCVVASLLFLFYGVVSPTPWKFFGWRGSAALWLTAACVGCSAASPFLATSWIRLPRRLRAAVYLPIAIAVVASIRNTTGTNEALEYSISPWPAVPLFGIEVGGLFIASAFGGIAVASLGWADGRRSLGGRCLRVGLGFLLPLGILAVASGFGLLPFELGGKTLAGVVTLCAVSTALLATRGGGDAEIARRRAWAMGTGAALVAIPLFAGQVLARMDYYVTREWRAREIIDALAHYASRDSLYPDSLSELVDAGYIAGVPRPAIGFRLFYDPHFRYQSFGSSYILEFEAPRWVECAYTPPYGEEADEGISDVAPVAEAWSCPSESPKLW